MENSKTKRINFDFVDPVRAIATIAVILIHSSGEVVNNFNKAEWNDWWMCNFFNSISRWSVPFFVFLSGSLLLSPHKNESISNFYKKRIKRVFIPFLFWALVYFVYTFRYNFRDGIELPWYDIKNLFLTGDVYFHLWFVSMILGLYVFTPILRVYLRSATLSEIHYFIIVWFVLASISTYYPKFFLVKFVGWIGYVGMYLLGYYLIHYPDYPYKKWIERISLVLFLLVAPATYYLSAQYGVMDGSWYIYLAPQTILYSAVFFQWFTKIDWTAFSKRNPFTWKVFHQISFYSYGIYLIHAIILDCFKNGYFGTVIYNTQLFGVTLPSLVAVPIVVLLVVISSYLVIWLLKKIPILGDWVG